MGNVSLKVLKKFLNFLFKKGYETCFFLCRGRELREKSKNFRECLTFSANSKF